MTSYSQTPSTKFKLLVAAAIGCLACAVWWTQHSHAGSSDGPPVGVVKIGDLIQKITVAGTVIPKRRTAIMPPYTGYVRKVYAQIGKPIRAGDPVVLMSQTLADSESQSYPLRAPFSGTVVQVLHLDGEYVQTTQDNAMLVRIDDLSSLYAMTDVPELDIGKIKLGQEVIVKATPILDRAYHGVVREISLAAREKKEWSRTSDKVDFPVKIEVTDPDNRIMPGMSALIDIVANKKSNVLLLRHEFVQQSGEQYFVQLESGEKREIKVGIQDEENFEILSGLKQGDRLKLVDFLAISRSLEPE